MASTEGWKKDAKTMIFSIEQQDRGGLEAGSR
jgi:hypothetical protein